MASSSLMPTLAYSISPTNFKGITSTPNPWKFRRISFPIIRANSTLADSSSLLYAAKHTVDTHIKSGMVIGLGSGHASGMAIQYLGRQLRIGVLKDIVGIPMSIASASEAAKAGIRLDQYQDGSQIDFAFDDADVLEEDTLIAVVGRQKMQGEESFIQEKIWRRPSIGQAGPLGGDFPLVTREGHNVLDVIFTSPIQSLAEVAESLDKVDGVVDHGIISKFPCSAVIASDSGLYIVNNPSTDAETVVL
ncbi:probable ribose-5-phosphate isomerase 4, chloroplastic isoform X2 [Ricinus communis]|uniref:probable ribose-5-phosphate isomerase 4, chloroplastic isoform X2 n=1 Tax=Ricinus communis TaxID=3988 RepID=UPI00201A4FF6|nr:probable ribose-5-phosphate isomerase 4, chloroplastic isoform X2 [Ricinus communis]